MDIGLRNNLVFNGGNMKYYSRVKRGMVFWFDPTKTYNQTNQYVTSQGSYEHSHIQNYNRPWLVVSSDYINFSTSVCTIVPITTEKEGKKDCDYHYTFEVDGKMVTLLLEQIRTVDMGALGDFFYCLSDDFMRIVDKLILGLFCSSNTSHTTTLLEGDSSDTLSSTSFDLSGNLPLVALESEPENYSEGEGEKKKVTQNSKYVKDYSGLSQVERFNARYGIKTEPEKEDKPKAKRTKWDTKMAEEYLDDFSKLTVEEIMKKWDLPTRKSVSQRKYYCTKLLEKK